MPAPEHEATGKPRAKITRKNRFDYTIILITEDGKEYGPGSIFGVYGWSASYLWTARLRADRELRKYHRLKVYKAQGWVIEEGGSS